MRAHFGLIPTETISFASNQDDALCASVSNVVVVIELMTDKVSKSGGKMFYVRTFAER